MSIFKAGSRVKTQNPRSDFPGLWSRYAHDADAPTPGRSGYGNNRVFEAQRCCGTKLTAIAAVASPRAAASAAARTASAVTSAKSPALSRTPGSFRTGPRRPNRLRKRLHIGGHNHHLPDRSFADAFAPHFG